MNKWDLRFLELAEQIAQWSKDPSGKIGAVAVDPITHRILSTGYNGFPRGILDTAERLNDRPTKYRLVVHAETNCIYNATFSGTSLFGAHMYAYGLPICSECAKAIISVGVSQVFVAPKDSEIPERWKDSWEISLAMFDEAGVGVSLFNGAQYEKI